VVPGDDDDTDGDDVKLASVDFNPFVLTPMNESMASMLSLRVATDDASIRFTERASLFASFNLVTSCG